MAKTASAAASAKQASFLSGLSVIDGGAPDIRQTLVSPSEAFTDA